MSGTDALHLSPRQKEIVSLIADGLSDKEIAVRLGMSPRTVGSHLARVYALHDVHKRARLVAAVLGTDSRLAASTEQT